MGISKKIGLVGTLASTIIGAGVFSLPFVFQSVGARNGLMFLFLFFVVYSIIHVMYASLIRENKDLEFGGLAKKYFGKRGYAVQWLTILELTTVCIAYLALAPEFFLILFNHLPASISVILFLFLGVICMTLPMKFVEIFETVGLAGIIILIGIIGWFGIISPNTVQWVTRTAGVSQYLLLFGPLLFALSGRPIIARIVRSVSGEEQKDIPMVLVLGTLIPAALYGIYTLGILAINPHVTEHVVQTISLFSPLISQLLSLLGIIALLTSYFVVAGNVRDELVIDIKANKILAFLFAVFVPAILYFLGINNFVSVISFVGGVFLACEGFLIVRMWQKQRNKKDVLFYGSCVLYIVFLLALIQELKQFVWH